jgi:DNA-binding NarL/FixJ family response regulator
LPRRNHAWFTIKITINIAEGDVVTRIVIADDHMVVRIGVRHLLESHVGWEVVGEAADGKEAVATCLETKPDIAIIDYSLPLLNGIEASRQILAALPKTEILVFTMHDNERVLTDLLAVGARGYLLKSDSQRYLVRAIETLAMHKPFFTAKASEALLAASQRNPQPGRSTLTTRERSVVQLIAEGNTNKQVANILAISVKTVETHRGSIMRKLSLPSSAALVRYAVRNNLVER